MRRVAVYGARGFVGRQIVRGLRRLGVEPIEVVRGQDGPRAADVLVNAACPSQRLRAEREPMWDFHETVTKTADLFYGVAHDRFLQVSSLSARYPQNTIYGRHRLMAEQLIRPGLVVRLGPMYGDGLRKGYLADILAGRPVYADPDTRYAYADVEWVGEQIAALALSDAVGMREVGGSGWVRLGDLGGDFRPSEYLPREDQVFVAQNGPDSRLVYDWLEAVAATDY
jgi:nucleoside-diphosphate-sugar epimerase